MSSRRELLRVAGAEPIGLYTLLRLERGELDPGAPGQFFMLEAPGRLLPRALSLCLAPPGELAFLIDPIGPGTQALCELERGDEIHVFGPLGHGFRLDVARPLLVGGGIGMAPLPVSRRGAPLPAGRARLPHGRARGSGRASARRGDCDRPDVRHRADPARRTTCSRAGRSRCSTRSPSSVRARSSPGKRRWRAATAAATAASSRSTAS